MSGPLRLPTSILDLAQHNAQVMRDLSLPIEVRGLAESRVAGETYITSVYPMYNKPALMQEACGFPRTREQNARLVLSTGIARDFNVGVFLVRPEMYHARGLVENFLTTNGFRIAYLDERRVDAQGYAPLCELGFRTPAARPAWPTRTIVYLDSPCALIVFTDPEKRFGEESRSDNVVKHFKGREGVEDLSTVRGSVVFKEARRLGFHTLDDPDLAMALDPFTAIRNIVQLPGEQPHSHLTSDRRLLKYNAVSVHVPDASELVRDLAILNTTNQLEEIHESIARI